MFELLSVYAETKKEKRIYTNYMVIIQDSNRSDSDILFHETTI